MLCELTKAGARTTLQMIKGEVFRDGVIVEAAGGADCKSNTVMFHKLYVELKCNGWKELQVYL